MRKLIKYNRKAVIESKSYKVLPFNQISMLDLSPEERMILLCFFGNKEKWTIGETYITEQIFYRKINQKRVKVIIKKLKKMEYLTETETEYIINFDKIQNDFEKNKEILTASQVLEFERKKKNLTASQVKTLLPVRFDVLTPSQDNSTNADTTLCRMRPQEHPSNVHQHINNNIIEEEGKKDSLFLPLPASLNHHSDATASPTHLHSDSLAEAKGGDEKKNIQSYNNKVIINDDVSNDTSKVNTQGGGDDDHKEITSVEELNAIYASRNFSDTSKVNTQSGVNDYTSKVMPSGEPSDELKELMKIKADMLKTKIEAEKLLKKN